MPRFTPAMVLGLISLLVSVSATRAPAVCVWDCSQDGEVTIDELLTLVNIGLGTAVVTACPAGDADSSGDITIDEILRAVGNALNGCSASPTPTPQSGCQSNDECSTTYPYCGPDGNCWTQPCSEVCSGGNGCCGGDYPHCGPNDTCWTQPCVNLCSDTSCCGGDYPYCGPDNNCWSQPCTTLCGDTCCGPGSQCMSNQSCSH